MTPAPARPACTLQGLSFCRATRAILTGVDATLPAGVTWLQGANGSGKSTLMQLLAGVLPLQAGQVRLAPAGAVLEASAPASTDWKRQVFWCGPGPVAFDHLSPEQYWRFLAGLYPHWQADVAWQQARALGLAPQLRTPMAQLSTGTQRKAWLCAVLAAGTPLRLLDEPLNALDAEARAALQAALAAEHAAARAVWLVASHGDPVDGAAAVPTLTLRAGQARAGAAPFVAAHGV